MRDQHIADIRAACIKANPEIKSLQFGCEVVGPWGTATILSQAREFLKAEKKYIGQRYHIIRGRTHSTLNAIAIKDVVGRPIRLADVLLTIDTRSKTGQWTIAMIGGFAHFTHDNDADDFSWELSKDDLTLQSDECVAFLADLLK